MISYSVFNTTDDHAYNVYNAINYCREHGEDCLMFEKGKYDFYPEKAAEHLLHVSNHSIYTEKRIAFLLENMKNFTVDGEGSDFVFHSDMVPFALLGSKNITVKNLSIDYDRTMSISVQVTDIGESTFDFLVLDGGKYYIEGTRLHIVDGCGNDEPFRYFCLVNNGEDKQYIPESRDSFDTAMYFEDLGEGRVRVHKRDMRIELRVGMRLVMRAYHRHACNIVIDRSEDSFIENVTMYKSYGMGLLAEKSTNVTVDRMNVKARENAIFSLNADATHFVNCKGLVKVTNSSFSEQQDDALNIHGEFNPVVDKTNEFILVKYVHPQAKGLGIFEVGDEFAVLTPKTLIQRSIRRVKSVEVINMNYTKLFVEGGTDGIEIGDIVEDLTWSCDLIFENNTVCNNRARGMLIAAKGKVEVRNNYFNTPGVAILFESDGKYWFESGGTNDVRIIGNTFDNCRFTHGNWGRNVIEMKPREEFDGEHHYHQYVEITDNRFVNNAGCLLSADNVSEIVFKNNFIKDQADCELAVFANCGKIDTDM